jgi:hypothetical protein
MTSKVKKRGKPWVAGWKSYRLDHQMMGRDSRARPTMDAMILSL